MNKSVKEVFEEALQSSFIPKDGYEYVKYTFKNQSFLFVYDEIQNDFPIKVYPLNPSGKELFGFRSKVSGFQSLLFNIYNDFQKRQVHVCTPLMKEIVQNYKRTRIITLEDAKDFIDEICIWTWQTSQMRVFASNKKKKKKSFTYVDYPNEKCKKIVLSNRADLSIFSECLSRGDLETTGVLLGHYKNGIWYVVEATDPGLNPTLEVHTCEMDNAYVNHMYPVLSRLYKKDLNLLGLWHRHPASFDKFSNTDHGTNMKFAKSVGDGTLSFLVNFDDKERLTCYFLDKETRTYHKVPFVIGDKYFKDTEFLERIKTF